MISTEEILRRLRNLREERFLRQESLAGQLGIDRSTYARKEGGDIPITTGEWLKLAEIMGADISYFFGPPPPPPPPTTAAGGNVDGTQGKLLLQLYNSLSPEERQDLVAGIHLLLKGIRKKKVREALERLVEAR
ncbi:MAG: helix-turn-helix domain-containing protein [Thermodesulfobacteriota bacterium]